MFNKVTFDNKNNNVHPDDKLLYKPVDEGVHLKKQFTKVDVQRLRNIFSGKADEKTVIQVGYQAKEVSHKDGEVFEEGGKTWVIKDGIKQSYTKLDAIKKELRTPLMCPCCGNRMKHKNDPKMYAIHGKCFDCVLKMETQLKLEGKYQDYVKSITIPNAKAFVKDAKTFIEEVKKQDKYQTVTESGKIEEHAGKAYNDSVLESMLKEIEDFEKTLN